MKGHGKQNISLLFVAQKCSISVFMKIYHVLNISFQKIQEILCYLSCFSMEIISTFILFMKITKKQGNFRSDMHIQCMCTTDEGMQGTASQCTQLNLSHHPPTPSCQCYPRQDAYSYLRRELSGNCPTHKQAWAAVLMCMSYVAKSRLLAIGNL